MRTRATSKATATEKSETTPPKKKTPPNGWRFHAVGLHPKSVSSAVFDADLFGAVTVTLVNAARWILEAFAIGVLGAGNRAHIAHLTTGIDASRRREREAFEPFVAGGAIVAHGGKWQALGERAKTNLDGVVTGPHAAGLNILAVGIGVAGFGTNLGALLTAVLAARRSALEAAETFVAFVVRLTHST